MITKKRKAQFICLAILLCIMAVLGSVTYARYKSVVEKEFTLQAKTLSQTANYHITSENGWQNSGSGMVLDFTLSKNKNSNTNRAAYLRLTATEGLSSTATVSISVDGNTYQATRHTVYEGTVLYTQMGGGYEFRFETASGELNWQISEAKSMRISVQGASDQALLRLVLMEK